MGSCQARLVYLTTLLLIRPSHLCGLPVLCILCTLFRWKLTTGVGNFIIGASGSDKQMLCASSGARAALNIAAEKSKQKR